MSSLKLAVALAGTLKIMEFQVCQLNSFIYCLLGKLFTCCNNIQKKKKKKKN